MSEADEEGELRRRIEVAVVELQDIAKDETCMGRLHEIERMMVQDVIAENRHLRCTGCLRWIERLVQKASGEDN